MNSSPITTLLNATTQFLRTKSAHYPYAQKVLDCIAQLGIENIDLQSTPKTPQVHNDVLTNAISSITDEELYEIQLALNTAKNHLNWSVDQGKFYAGEADLGDSFRIGNSHSLLIGPQNAPIQKDDFLLGFFLLAPKTLYRDHQHLAPELYVPLTGPSGWRFGTKDWEDHPATTVIYNEPNAVHATRVYDVPFLALFVWTKDVSSPCAVVHFDDWDEIEKEL